MPFTTGAIFALDRTGLASISPSDESCGVIIACLVRWQPHRCKQQRRPASLLTGTFNHDTFSHFIKVAYSVTKSNGINTKQIVIFKRCRAPVKMSGHLSAIPRACSNGVLAWLHFAARCRCLEIWVSSGRLLRLASSLDRRCLPGCPFACY